MPLVCCMPLPLLDGASRVCMRVCVCVHIMCAHNVCAVSLVCIVKVIDVFSVTVFGIASRDNYERIDQDLWSKGQLSSPHFTGSYARYRFVWLFHDCLLSSVHCLIFCQLPLLVHD